MIKNNSLFVTQTLDSFTPKLNGWKLSVLVGSASIIALIAIMIQSAVYRSLKSLGSRHINQMIIPSLVKFSSHIYLFHWGPLYLRRSLRFCSLVLDQMLTIHINCNTLQLCVPLILSVTSGKPEVPCFLNIAYISLSIWQ